MIIPYNYAQFDFTFIELIKTFGISFMYITPFLIQTCEIKNAYNSWKIKKKRRRIIYRNYLFYHGCYIGFNLLLLSSQYFLGYDVLASNKIHHDASLYLTLFGGLSMVQLYSNSIIQRVKNCMFVYSIVVPYFMHIY